MTDAVSEIALEVVTAALMWGLAVMLPFRRMDASPQFRWDLSAVAFAFCFALLAGYTLSWLYQGLEGSMEWWYSAIGNWPAAAVVTGYVIFADLSSYVAHRLLHTRWLWHAHAFHHSSRHLYVLSGLRSSLIHVAALFAGPLLALSLFPVYELPVIFAVITVSQVANQHYTHSNIRVPFAPLLEFVFVTPRYHFVHHSVDRKFSDSNFGFLFSIWDRMFGTYTDPATVAEEEALGLDYDNSNWRLLLGIPPRAG